MKCAAAFLLAVAFAMPVSAQIYDPNEVLRPDVQRKPSYMIPTPALLFNSTLVRISGDENAAMVAPDGAIWGADARHHYMTDQPWSRNEKYYYIENSGAGGALILSGQTLLPSKAKCAYVEEWDGSTPNPHLIVSDSWWAIANNNPLTDDTYRIGIDKTHDAIFAYDALTCRIIKGHGFASNGRGAIAVMTGGWQINGNGVSEGQSWDGRIQVILNDNGSNPPTKLRAVDLGGTDTRIGDEFDPIADCPLASSECVLDMAMVAPSGNYVVMNYSKNEDHTRVLTLNRSTLLLETMNYSSVSPVPYTYNCVNYPLYPSSGIIGNLGHLSVGKNPYDGDKDVVVGQRKCPSKGTTVGDLVNTGDVIMITLSTGVYKALTHSQPDRCSLDLSKPCSVTSACPTGKGVCLYRAEANARHVSMVSYDAPGWATVTYNTDLEVNAPNLCPKYWDEVIQVNLRGEDYGVRRMARTHTPTQKNVDAPDPYRCEGHAVSSPSGNRVAFASCWTQNCLYTHTSPCGDRKNPQDYIVTATLTLAGTPTTGAYVVPGRDQ